MRRRNRRGVLGWRGDRSLANIAEFDFRDTQRRRSGPSTRGANLGIRVSRSLFGSIAPELSNNIIQK